MRTYPKCDHCDKRVWFDPYGPGWVHFRGTVWCKGTDTYATVTEEEMSYGELYSLYLGGSWG